MRRAVMISLFPLLALGVIALSTSAQKRSPPNAAAAPEMSDDEVVNVNTTLVTVPVSVKDRSGKIVSDLRREDFRLYEDGVEQEIVYFDAPQEPAGAKETGGANAGAAGKPFTVALLLDVSDSTQFKLEQIQSAANVFVNLLRPDDRVLVVAFDKRVQVLAEATNDRNVLREAVARARTGGGTRLYNALDAVVSHRLNRVSGRKAVVLFTDGVDTASVGATYDSTIRAAEESDAAIYPIQYNTYGDFTDNPSRVTYTVGNLGGTAHMTRNGELASEAYKRATTYLRLLAEKTGGRFQYADNLKHLRQSFANIASVLRQQYALGYYPKNRTASGAKRQIKVKVQADLLGPAARPRARESYTVRARESYVDRAQTTAGTKQ